MYVYLDRVGEAEQSVAKAVFVQKKAVFVHVATSDERQLIFTWVPLTNKIVNITLAQSSLFNMTIDCLRRREICMTNAVLQLSKYNISELTLDHLFVSPLAEMRRKRAKHISSFVYFGMLYNP